MSYGLLLFFLPAPAHALAFAVLRLERMDSNIFGCWALAIGA